MLPPRAHRIRAQPASFPVHHTFAVRTPAHQTCSLNSTSRFTTLSPGYNDSLWSSSTPPVIRDTSANALRELCRLLAGVRQNFRSARFSFPPSYLRSPPYTVSPSLLTDPLCCFDDSGEYRTLRPRSSARSMCSFSHAFDRLAHQFGLEPLTPPVRQQHHPDASVFLQNSLLDIRSILVFQVLDINSTTMSDTFATLRATATPVRRQRFLISRES